MSDGGAFGAAAQIGQQLLGSGVLEGSGHSNTNTKDVKTGKTNTAVRGTTVNRGTNVGKTSTQGTVDTSGSTVNTGGSTTNTKVVGTADQSALNKSRQIVTQALRNENNKSAINGLIDSVLNKASISFGQTQGNLGVNAGIYNSSTMNLLRGFAKGQATADAVQAVLDYKTSQQQIATQANQGILDATKGSSTIGKTADTNTSNTTSNQQSNTIGTNVDTSTNIGKSVQDTKGISVDKEAGSSHVQQNSNSQQNGLLDNSIICSELLRQGKLSSRAWMIGAIHFNNGGVSSGGKIAYYTWAEPVVRHIRKHPAGTVAKVFARLMQGRSNILAFHYGRKIDRKKENPFHLSDALCYLTIDGITRASWLFSVLPSLVKEKLISSKWKEFDEFDRSIS